MRKFVTSAPTKSCFLDPIPTWFLKDCILPTLKLIVNKSLSEGTFPSKCRAAIVCPLIKKSKLDADTQNLQAYF